MQLCIYFWAALYLPTVSFRLNIIIKAIERIVNGNNFKEFQRFRNFVPCRVEYTFVSMPYQVRSVQTINQWVIQVTKGNWHILIVRSNLSDSSNTEFRGGGGGTTTMT
jgi:hypothetical protein